MAMAKKMDPEEFIEAYRTRLKAFELKGGFSNPDKKPIEELFLIIDEDGVDIKVPALNKRWAPKDFIITYLPLLVSGGKVKTDVELDQWIYEAEFFLEDMKFLLRLKHFQFWSYMVYQEAAIDSVILFLKKSNPFYIDISSLPPDKEANKLYEDILTSVVRIVCRIITNKENDEEWMSREHLKTLIYEKYLISVPMLFDLIIALGEDNHKLLRRIFHTVFEIEPKYKEDLTLALKHFIEVFELIAKQAEDDEIMKAGEKNRNLDTPYDDLVLFTLDTAMTLSILLDVYPPARQICIEINLAEKITCFYDTTIPYLFKNIYIINKNVESLKWLNETRCQLLKAFRSIVYVHIENVMNDPENSIMPAENFVAVMTQCLADRMFVIDYQREYPIELDVDILKQACKDLDDFKTSFVAKGYKDEADSEVNHTIGALEAFKLQEELDYDEALDEANRPQPDGEAAELDYDDDKPSTSRAALKHASSTAGQSHESPSPTERNIDDEVTSVLDVLPHLGDGFVRRVLDRYDNSEDAIAAILEQNLPPDLIHADQTEVYIPPDPQDALYEQTGVRRYNIFDGDKYDIMSNENPDCIIKRDKGFPDDPKDLSEMLDDKRDLAAYRHRYQEYSMVQTGIYDDEYDDTYDGMMESESRISSKQFRRTLADIEDIDGYNEDEDDDDDKLLEDEAEEEDEEEENDEEEKQQHRNNYKGAKNSMPTYEKPMDFCENPEIIRARYEARRAAKYGNPSNQSKAPPPPQQRDVVGAAKGKGQSKEVTVNRHKKDVNKSSRANHNRKSGAAFKRSKGMMG